MNLGVYSDLRVKKTKKELGDAELGWLLPVVLPPSHFHEHPSHSHSSAKVALELLCFLLVPGAGAAGGQELLHVVRRFPLNLQ